MVGAKIASQLGEQETAKTHFKGPNPPGIAMTIFSLLAGDLSRKILPSESRVT